MHPPGELFQPIKPEDLLSDFDIDMIYFYFNRKDLPRLKLDDVSNN